MRIAASVVAVAALSVGLVFYGRYEGRSAERAELRGMAAIYRSVRPELFNASTTTYDPVTRVSCFLYQRDGDLLGTSVCFTPQRRLIEAVNYRHRPPHIYSLLYDLDAGKIRLTVPEFLRANNALYHFDYFYGQ